MPEFQVGPDLVGGQVRNAARPEWGVGEVLKVQTVEHGGASVHRVTVHFPIGTRVLLAPPARLVAPTAEPQRARGWIESLGKSTLDDRLRQVRPEMLDVLGTPRARIVALMPLYAFTEDPKSLARWACDQTGVTDPLSHWNRDELIVAFQDFCVERDSHFRNLVAVFRQAQDADAVRELLAEAPSPLRERMAAALARII